MRYFLIVLFLLGCGSKSGYEEKALKFLWNGTKPIFQSNYKVSRDSVVQYNLSPLKKKAKILLFEDWDTVKCHIQKFSTALEAFYHFQSIAPDAQSLNRGDFETDNKRFFRNGKYFGCVYFSSRAYLSRHVLHNNFNLPSESLLPEAFESLPFLDRYGETERVYKDEYLGIKLDGWVLESAYPCHRDTALVFRILENESNENFLRLTNSLKLGVDTLTWAKEYASQGISPIGEPVEIFGYPKGVVGVVGCVEPDQTQKYLKKLKKLNALAIFS